MIFDNYCSTVEKSHKFVAKWGSFNTLKTSLIATSYVIKYFVSPASNALMTYLVTAWENNSIRWQLQNDFQTKTQMRRCELATITEALLGLFLAQFIFVSWIKVYKWTNNFNQIFYAQLPTLISVWFKQWIVLNSNNFDCNLL
jgi:hypothetical protein